MGALKNIVAATGLLAAAGIGETVYFYNRTMKRGNAKTERTTKMSGTDWAKYFPLMEERKKFVMVQQHRDVYLTSFDGLKLHATYFPAINGTEQAEKIVICFHGYTGEGLSNHMAIADYFLKHGYAMLLPDARAHGESEGEYIGFGCLDRQDALSWIRWTIRECGENVKIMLHGTSMGGATVLMASGLELPANVKGIVSDCGFTSPKEVFTDPKGNVLVDFGQNLTVLVEVKIKGRKGQEISLRHAEVLDKDGVFYPDTLRTAISKDAYILNGEEQVLMPHFTFHGFRYALVEGIENPAPEMFTACVMHSDMEKTGNFHCSDENVNRLQDNIDWSLRDNFFDIPTDCPQRDERLGWTGDAQVFSWTAAFNRGTASFFRKWMHDVAAASSLEKGVPHIVPDIQGTYSSAAWSDVAVIVPWVVYQTYGDTRILEDSWQCMHEWVDYIHNQVNEDGLWKSGFQYGDWKSLDREMFDDGSVGATDIYLIANAYYLYVTDLVAKTARVLGKDDEAARYEKLYKETLESFREEYFTPRGRVVSETQTGCVLSLHFGLAREKDREKILRALVANVEDHKNHLTTGFVGTPYLCHALSDNGAHDVASVLFLRDDYPSWLYGVKMGATTMWEQWNAIYPDQTMPHPGSNSMNHYAYGSIGDWMYRKIGGINQLEAAYHKFYVKPMFVRGIEEACTELETPYGKIVSEWSCRDKKIRVRVTVPANTSAVIYLPEKEGALEVGSGEHVYEYDTTTSLKPARFTLDNTLGEIMAEPLGKQMLDQMMPELMANPMIEYAKRMTLAEGISSAPAVKAAYEAILDALNGQ